MTQPLHGDAAWRRLLKSIFDQGLPVAPRQQPTLEVLHTNHIQVDMRRPVVTTAARKLNYRFMAAEALWILSGSNELAPLTQYVKRMADFSDDGVTLSGAYGPPVQTQLKYVTSALLADRDTRQAVLTIWRQNPQPSKDIPCTVAMVFSIRDDKLHQHVFMRSSDAWLGVPYDMFSFACIGLKVACDYNLFCEPMKQVQVAPGTLTISMTSSHLYERNFEEARAVLAAPAAPRVPQVPLVSILNGAWREVDASLVALRENMEMQDWMWRLDQREEDSDAQG